MKNAIFFQFLLLVAWPGLLRAQQYHHLEGRVGDDWAAVVDLHLDRGRAWGSCHYAHLDKPRRLVGTLEGSTLELREYANDWTEIGAFSGQLGAQGFSGAWASSDGGRSLSFGFRAAPAALSFEAHAREDFLDAGLGRDIGHVSSVFFLQPTDCPTAPDLLPRLSKEIATRFFGADALPDDPEENISQTLEREHDVYRDEVLNGILLELDADEVLGEKGYQWDWSDHSVMTVAYNEKGILSLDMNFMSNSSGAHGSQGSRMFCFDLVSGKEITASDVFSSSARKQLAELVGGILREEFGPDAFFEAAIEPNDNFFCYGAGVAFTYQPNEIGPSALGHVTAYLPFEKVKHLMKRGNPLERLYE